MFGADKNPRQCWQNPLLQFLICGSNVSCQDRLDSIPFCLVQLFYLRPYVRLNIIQVKLQPFMGNGVADGLKNWIGSKPENMDNMKISVPKTVLQFFYAIKSKAWTDLYSLWPVRAEKYLTGFYPNSLQEVAVVTYWVRNIYDNAGTNFCYCRMGSRRLSQTHGKNQEVDIKTRRQGLQSIKGPHHRSATGGAWHNRRDKEQV
jgi:hypothetical protein